MPYLDQPREDMPEAMSPAIRDAIQQIVAYGIDDEHDHWEENDKPENHIYHAFKTLDDWLIATEDKAKRQA